MASPRCGLASGFLAVCLACAALVAVASGDVVRLRTGEAIQGTVILRTDEKVVIATASGLRTVRATDVQSIEEEKDPRAEYVRRAAALGPRDAKGWYELGTWAQDQRLEAEATHCFEQVIRIDPDHAEARAALGYRRWGPGWRKAEEIEKARKDLPETVPPPPPSPPTPGSEPGPEPSPEATPGVPAPADPGPGSTSPPQPGLEKETPPEPAAPGGEAGLGAIARKIEEKIQVQFRDGRFGDLLFHTTADPNSRAVQATVGSLLETHNLILRCMGAKARDVWAEGLLPVYHFQGRLQFFKFADLWDGRKPGPQLSSYFDAKGPHIALFGTPDAALIRSLTEGMLEFRKGERVEAIGWLKLGLGEWISIAQDSADGTRRRTDAYRAAGKLLAAHDRNADVLLWLEDVGLPSGAGWARPMAFTMVDLLATPPAPGRPERLSAFIARMREAPPLRTPGIQGFDPAFEKYLEYQRDALRRVYRLEPETFAKYWEARVQPPRK
ncbi:MAG: hypothetical protein JXP34_00700 [Planctomycetes bacterium]|nr:hypothetical protein [Planctomycetota bacterium]